MLMETFIVTQLSLKFQWISQDDSQKGEICMFKETICTNRFQIE